MKFYVYALYRGDGTPFYVGRGTGWRWNVHEYDALRGKVKGNPQKHKIIKAILASGLPLDKRKLGSFATSEEASAFEVETIRLIGRTINGGPLVNRTDGGEGGLSGMAQSPETRKKIGDAKRGKKMPEGFGERMSKVHKGRVWDREVVERRTAPMRGRPLSEEHKAKISAAHKGVPLSESHAAALRGKKRSPESCANISKSLKGRRLTDAEKAERRSRRHSAETRRKMSEAKIGKTKSEETRANMRAAWVKRRAAKCA